MNVLTTASRQWAMRPDDERFLTLESLYESVASRYRESWTAETPCNLLRVLPDTDGDLKMHVQDRTVGERIVSPSNWSFGQLANYAGAPGSYLRKLPSELAAINLQWGLEHAAARENALVLGHSNGDHRLRAMTSTSYGRIWDKEVVSGVQQVNQDGRWTVPAASYTATNPKRATTLYASDRDVFIFLVDITRPIQVGDETLFRGFMTWNSEVGSAVFGLTTFLYRFVCDNRMIWGATDIKELRIRHTGGAPERFLYEGAKYLKQYSEQSDAGEVQMIQKAQAYELPTDPKDLTGWLTSRGFTGSQAQGAIDTAKSEEGQSRTLWDIVNGVTAYARKIPYTNERVALETAAGKLMNAVSNN